MRILERLEGRFPLRVNVIRDHQVTHAEALAMKRRSHIVIDECVTGSYHTSSLEGLATGCVVINGVGLLPGVLDAVRYCIGGEASNPFTDANLETLESVLAELIRRGPDALAVDGAANRRWMEEHWDFARHWERLWMPLLSQARVRMACVRDAPRRVQPHQESTDSLLSTAGIFSVSSPASRPVGFERISGGPPVKSKYTTRTTERLLHRRHEFLRKHRDMHGQIRSDIWREGIKHIKRMKIAAGVLRRGLGFAPAPVSFVGAQWTQVGPTPLRVDKDQLFQGAGPVSGEVTDIVIDPRGGTDQTIYLSPNDGGIWKSPDGGTTWAPKTDGMPSLSMGAVALDPADPNTVYAGTGNLFDGAGLFAGAGFKGVGIYKSTDSGETSSTVGSAVFTNQGINRIALPAPNVLLVATNTGLFRSVDGGLNFGANAPLFNDQNPILGAGIPINDLKLDTASSSTIYAAVQGQGILHATEGVVSFP